MLHYITQILIVVQKKEKTMNRNIDKRKHLITKIILGLCVITFVFFALCDCAPTPKTTEVIVTYEKD